ncbi:hypothetical protein M406DRAFT_349400 [Cryphonectria parasitica EP155]|uniref:Uncharacterized protein n=1 Tax=Cryphonectria parasitica (strain ATCC 38755 / EP155) TaxID=660469 RepID=A0A9P4YCG2_CRYP1|nr:uncharacterized protein M406DRAFT_349400 [Cryphonectria parasitica EP155]KAF3770803.1 hypothetical protein M406DRAFT_349400 [Cryphonectria parasitica EP155]
MALPGEGSDVEALRKRIEYGLNLLGREENAATRERMKAAIEADRERLGQLENDQPQRERPRATPQRPRAMSKSKIWDVIEKANQVSAGEPPRKETPSHNQPQAERETPRREKEPTTPTAKGEDEQQRRAQIIAELQRRRDVLMAQLHPQPAAAAPDGPTAEETRREEEERARKKQEQAKLDLQTAVPRERSSGLSYSWVSPTVGSFGPEARDLPKPTRQTPPGPGRDAGGGRGSSSSSSSRTRTHSEDRHSTRPPPAAPAAKPATHHVRERTAHPYLSRRRKNNNNNSGSGSTSSRGGETQNEAGTAADTPTTSRRAGSASMNVNVNVKGIEGEAATAVLAGTGTEIETGVGGVSRQGEVCWRSS